jgi:hypothetical protein
MTEERVTDETIDESAGLIARRLLSRADGPIHAVSTWTDVARRSGVRVLRFFAQSAAPGWYVSDRIPDGSEDYLSPPAPIIYVNGTLDEESQVRVLIHELAHDAIDNWEPPRLSGLPPADLRAYDDDADDVHHRIARKVEEIVLG